MQRRLTFVFVAVALASIVLVGAGVLLFSAVGARSEATERVEQQLAAFSTLDADVQQPGGPLAERFGRAFGAEQVAIVRVDDAGDVRTVTRADTGRAVVLGDIQMTMDGEQLAAFRTGEPIVLDASNSVVGLQRIGTGSSRTGMTGILISQSVGRVPAQATRWFLISAAVVLAGAAGAAVWMARRIVAPITAIEHATTTIAGGNLEPRLDIGGDDEIAQLATAVNTMASDLERSRALERQFLLSVSHDLRTPLTAIRGYAEALVDGAATDPLHAGAVIGRHADRLDRLVRDLLDLARLDARSTDVFRVEPEVVDPASIATRVVEGFGRTASDAALSLDVQAASGLAVRVDPTRMEQIVANLVENAIKFADTTIEVAVGPDAAGNVAITVIDDGPGIAAEDLPHIFERLYVTQLEPKRAESSSGLGLAIVRELTTAMGGTVIATPRTDGTTGTVMTVAFPLL